MVAQLVISADFSDLSGPILAGPTEASLISTRLRVADADSPLAAVRLLAGEYRRALVIDHHFDNSAGWTSRRRNFQRPESKTLPIQ